jgi:putative hydrolase of the HAD superfamily
MRRGAPPRAILLDALGTLVALQPPAPRLRTELAQRFGVSVSLAQAERAITAEIAYYRAHFDQGSDERGMKALRHSCVLALRAELPQQAESLPIERLTEALLGSIAFSAYADVLPVLGVARAQGVRLVVVSNWDISLHDLLARLRIGPLLDGIVTSAQQGARKPDPAIFVRGLELAGVGPAEAIHVGDSVEEDVAGARSAAIEPVLIRRDGSPGPAGTRTIASLSELVVT